MLISPEHLLIQIETAMDNDPRMPIDRRVKEGIIIRDRFMSSESKEQQNVFNITFYYFLAGKLASWSSDHRLDRQILECYIMMLRFCVSVRDYGTMEDVWEEITDFYLQIPNLTYGEIETKVPEIADLYMIADLPYCCYSWLETYLYYMSSVLKTHAQYDRMKAVRYMDVFLKLHRDRGCKGSDAIFRQIAGFAQTLLPRTDLISYGIDGVL